MADVASALEAATAGGGPTAGAASSLQLALPPSLDLNLLQKILSSIVDPALLSASAAVPTEQADAATAETQQQQQQQPALPIERITSPDASLILSIYAFFATQFSALQKGAADASALQAELARRGIEAESQLNDAEQSRAEAEQRAAQAEQLAAQAQAEKHAVDAQLAEASQQLQAAQSQQASGGAANDQAQQRIAQVEQEKRDLLALLDREKEESARNAGES